MGGFFGLALVQIRDAEDGKKVSQCQQILPMSLERDQTVIKASNDWDSCDNMKQRTNSMQAGQATKALDGDAYQQATSSAFPQVVEKLVSIIGRRLTAYIAAVKDARALDRWIAGTSPQDEVEVRLRLAYRIAILLAGADSPAVVKAWLLGLNPELEESVPIQLLREGDIAVDGKRVLGAATAFVMGG